ncbi:MAG: hypothetical protein IJQ82_13710 [Selenomonadaceae bacterium]|nr:hypothetical protein [Selenomonadaceae bacterium]
MAKVKIDFDAGNSRALFSLPDFSFPKRKSEAVADWNVVEKKQQIFVVATESLGIVDLACHEDLIRGVIKRQMGILDFGGFGQSTMPDIKIRSLRKTSVSAEKIICL